MTINQPLDFGTKESRDIFIKNLLATNGFVPLKDKEAPLHTTFLPQADHHRKLELGAMALVQSGQRYGYFFLTEAGEQIFMYDNITLPSELSTAYRERTKLLNQLDTTNKDTDISGVERSLNTVRQHISHLEQLRNFPTVKTPVQDVVALKTGCLENLN